MRKRIFIAIELPEKIKEKISEIVEELKPLFKFSIRWIEQANWHLTLVFLGYQNDEDIGLISEKLKSPLLEQKPFEILLEKIVYGPPGRQPRMIWVQAKSPEYGILKELIETELVTIGINFQKENRLPNPHLTLARFQQPIKNLPEIDTPLDLIFKTEIVTLMESKLTPTGAEYCPLKQFALSNL